MTFWPEPFSEAEAERMELLVHVHFDAKYRVEDVESLFGAADSDDSDKELAGNYKRQDLLKMHAYRDAIKRSQGAYVLYPGRSCRPVLMRGFHEILPGLGAFGVAPREDGLAQGMELVEEFLSEVLAHLGNRTTAQERVSYHVSEAYVVRESPVAYGDVSLVESDIYGPAYRALPPAEDMVLVTWFRNEEQRRLAEADDGIVFVRLGRRRGSLRVHPNLARVRHVLQRAEGARVACGLLLLREPGFLVNTRAELRDELRRRRLNGEVAEWEGKQDPDDDELIYALFMTRLDPTFASQEWNGDSVMELVEDFEADVRNRPVVSLGRTSPYPRVLPLRDLLKTRRK